MLRGLSPRHRRLCTPILQATSVSRPPEPREARSTPFSRRSVRPIVHCRALPGVAWPKRRGGPFVRSNSDCPDG